MRVTFLGTGTSHGVPVIGCECEICLSKNPKDKRLRSSILIEVDDTTIVIDTGPDFRMQMLRANVKKLDAVLFTHEHKDHTAGFDDVRAFNFYSDIDIRVFATERVQTQLKKSFDYIFTKHLYPGIPKVNLITIDNEEFDVDGVKVLPIEVMHMRLPVLGFRVHDFVYITDANAISETEQEKIRGCKVLVLNALRNEPHVSHFTLQQAIEMGRKLQAETVYFTHISHQLGFHDEVEKILPKNMHLSYDGLCLNLE